MAKITVEDDEGNKVEVDTETGESHKVQPGYVESFWDTVDSGIQKPFEIIDEMLNPGSTDKK